MSGFFKLYFHLSEYSDGTPFVNIGSDGGDEVQFFQESMVALELREGTTYEQAEVVVANLRQCIVGLSWHEI